LKTPIRLRLAVLAGTAWLAACGGGGGGNEPAPPAPVVPEEARAQDSKVYTPAAPGATTFAVMAGVAVGTDRWAGVLNGASYQIEVPATWNGKLVMYAHGYVGEVPTLNVTAPTIRRYLIENGYAWAASSYSKNSYDVRAGVEDTNALALAFNQIAAARGRPLPAPTKLYITGHSMGGHVTGAAIEEETYATAKNKVRYNGAAPMCGVMGDAELFNRFAGMQVAAQAIAGVPSYPTNKWSEIQGLVTTALFTTYNNANIVPSNPLGVRYLSVVENLTGGDRPLFDQGVAFGRSFQSAYGVFGSDGTVNGILNKNVLDTNAYTYMIDGDVPNSTALNASVQKLTATPDANRLRRDGLRWIPAIHGDFKVPVVSIHTLGDLFVPFSMQQIYRQRAVAKGNGNLLVQRAIRGASHCDFTVAEQVRAFSDMVAWAEGGPPPAGDDVSTPATVAAPTYGCTFTDNTIGPDDAGSAASLFRPAILGALPGVCPP
jgi:hypothetical protein